MSLGSGSFGFYRDQCQGGLSLRLSHSTEVPGALYADRPRLGTVSRLVGLEDRGVLGLGGLGRGEEGSPQMPSGAALLCHAWQLAMGVAGKAMPAWRKMALVSARGQVPEYRENLAWNSLEAGREEGATTP